MPSMDFEAGAYSVSFGGTDLGVTELGFQWVVEPSYIPIRADVTAQAVLDILMTGVRSMVIRFEGIEWSASKWSKVVDWMHGEAQGTVKIDSGQLIVAGNHAAALILTKITGTSGANGVQVGKKYTFAKAYPLEPVNQWFSAQRLRRLPAGFVVFGVPDPAQELVTFYTYS